MELASALIEAGVAFVGGAGGVLALTWRFSAKVENLKTTAALAKSEASAAKAEAEDAKRESALARADAKKAREDAEAAQLAAKQALADAQAASTVARSEAQSVRTALQTRIDDISKENHEQWNGINRSLGRIEGRLGTGKVSTP